MTMDPSDRELLQRYATDGEEAAFRILAGRYLDLVHGVARRVTRNDDLARDISQAVFVRLAQRAALIPPRLSLAAWLHRTTRSLAADLVRGEERRKKRERLMADPAMNEPSDSDAAATQAAWDALVPVIDRLVDALPQADREIVLARYYRNESHASIAARLGLSEPLARKRSSRALEKLRAMLGRHGLATSASTLAALMPAHALSSTAPAALLGTVLQAARGITPLAPGGMQTVLLLMNATQKITIAAAAVVFLASLGYAVRPQETAAAPGSPASSSTRASSSAPAGGRGPGSARSALHLPETAEARRKRLDQILALSSAAARRRELVAFVGLLQPGQFRDLCEAFPANFIPPDPNKPNLRAERALLLEAWAKRDPEDALKVLNEPYFFHREQLAKAMGAAHPGSALQWSREIPETRAAFLAGLGRVDLPAATGEIHDLPEKDRGRELHFLYVSMDMEPGLLQRMVALVEPSPERTYFLRQVTDLAASDDPTGALEALKNDPGGLAQADLTRIFGAYTRKSPQAAAAALDGIPEGALRLRAVTGLVQGIGGLDLGSSAMDATQAFALLDRYPDAVDDTVISGIARFGSFRHQEAAALEGLQRMSDPAARDELQTGYLKSWLKMEPGKAQAWLDAHAPELSSAVLQHLNGSEAVPVKAPLLQPETSPASAR